MTTSIKRSVIGVIFNKDRTQILVIKRRDVPIWVLPGGGIEQNESPKEAVIREVLEETGLIVSIIRHIAFYFPLNRLAYPTYVFECNLESGALSIGKETKQIGFFPLNALPIPFFFLHMDWIRDAVKNLSEPIEKPLTQITYWNFFKYCCTHPIQVSQFLLSRLGKPLNR